MQNLRLIILLVCLTLLSGCSSNFSLNLITDEAGNIIVEHQIDIGTAEKIKEITPGYQIASEEIKSRYFILYSDYYLNIKVFAKSSGTPSLPSDFPANVKFIVTYPGKIKETTATEVKGQKAIWLIKPGDVLNIRLSSRKWHTKQLIIISFLILFLIYKLFLGRKDERI